MNKIVKSITGYINRIQIKTLFCVFGVYLCLHFGYRWYVGGNVHKHHPKQYEPRQTSHDHRTKGADARPNVVVFFADDMGYGDLPCYGHPTSSAPNLNRLAAGGLVFTQFYSSSPICTPARSGLLTGRYATRSGTYPGVYKPDHIGGLPLDETTIAEALKPAGYRTGMIGKWHLGYGENGQYHPSHQGFDWYYGIPYTHGACPCGPCFYPNSPCVDTKGAREFVHCPLFANTTIIKQPVDLLTLDADYVRVANDFIKSSAREDMPFFLYYALHQLHIPIYSGERFTNKTIRGHYGDALAQMDWAVGEVVSTLESLGINHNTLVFFSSDNGPALNRREFGGSAGLLKCGKGTTYEGGQRVPGIAHWPGKITPGYTHQLASTLDLLPTICSLAGVSLPDAVLDGYDISGVLFQNQESPRQTFYYYPSGPFPKRGVYAVRYKQYKAHFYTNGFGSSKCHDPDCDKGNFQVREPPLLFDLHQDPSERFDISKDIKNTPMLNRLTRLKTKFDSEMFWAPSQLRRLGQNKSFQPCCKEGCQQGNLAECCKCDAHEGLPFE